MRSAVLILITISIFLFSGAAFAQEGLAGGAISISASEKGLFEPDTAELVLAVETTQKTVNLAAQENARKAGELVNALTAFVNATAGDSIKTTRYSVRPVYEWNEKEKKNILTGYMATNQVLLKTHSMDMTGKIIDKAVAAGANRVDSLNFKLGKETSYCGGLITKAAENAKQEAQELATALGVRLGKIKSATPSCGPVPKAGYTGPMLLEQSQGPSKTPIETGQIELKATVNVVFRIE